MLCTSVPHASNILLKQPLMVPHIYRLVRVPVIMLAGSQAKPAGGVVSVNMQLVLVLWRLAVNRAWPLLEMVAVCICVPLGVAQLPPIAKLLRLCRRRHKQRCGRHKAGQPLLETRRVHPMPVSLQAVLYVPGLHADEQMPVASGAARRPGRWIGHTHQMHNARHC